MSCLFLLNKTINFPLSEIKFLNFIFPDYAIVNNIYEFYNTNVSGIIYIGKLKHNTISYIERFTKNWIIVDKFNYDLDLSTNEAIIKYFFPIQYRKIFSKKSEISSLYNVYKVIPFNSLLERIKEYLILNKQLPRTNEEESNTYELYKATIGMPNQLIECYFKLLNQTSVEALLSSFLTFLNRVLVKNTMNCSKIYTNLILEANRRYGRKIKQGVSDLVNSNLKLELSFLNLLLYLNSTR